LSLPHRFTPADRSCEGVDLCYMVIRISR
jgi:hypothetical protein